MLKYNTRIETAHVDRNVFSMLDLSTQGTENRFPLRDLDTTGQRYS